ncbi:MAG: AmmeMemoRadiSam system protein A [Bacteroidales bacterium]|nr:AmmeMemoRadiSam system protein A [Bacteroidales bacterium]
MNINNKNQHTLLSIAEWSVQDYLDHDRIRRLPEKFHIDEELRSRCGVFVTIYVGKKLRGCIGTFSEDNELYLNVKNISVQAAFEDRRFKPVSANEISDMKVEISILSQKSRVSRPEEIDIGRHGIYLINGIRRATLLPQVAVQNDFSPVEFLECCAENKLGMHRDSWKDSEIFVYEVTVIK